VIVRLAELTDLAAIAHIQRVVFPYTVRSREAQRRAFETTPPRARQRFVVAEQDGQVVGFAEVRLNYWTSEPGEAIMGVNVLPEHRRQGVGKALLADAEAHLREIGAKTVRLWCPDNDVSASFATRHGYEARRSMRFSMVDPRQLPSMPAAPENVKLVNLFEAGLDAAYEFDCVASLDEPGDSPMDNMPKDEWTALHWGDPDQQHELGIMAIVDGVAVAGTFVEADLATGRSWSGFTGVLREYRGRGLAKLVKSVSLRRAAAAGITAAYTSNDAENAPMLAVNTWLGYQFTAAQRSYQKSF
jgi:GNAT superfamily N-acetyltransferase